MRTHGFHTSSRTLFLVLALTLACVSAAHADTWKPGDMTSYSQVGWSQSPGSTTLTNDFFSVYTTGAVDVGGTFLMEFTSASGILAYLPATNSPNVLDSNVQNPTSTISGSFGGDVLALSLDIAFSDAGKLAGTSGFAFGNLTLTGFNSTFPSLDGMTIRQYSGIVNIILGGGSSGGFTGADIGNLDAITASITDAFTSGNPSTFAQTNLAPPGSVATPEPSSLLLLGTGLLSLGFFRRRFLHT